MANSSSPVSDLSWEDEFEVTLTDALVGAGARLVKLRFCSFVVTFEGFSLSTLCCGGVAEAKPGFRHAFCAWCEEPLALPSMAAQEGSWNDVQGYLLALLEDRYEAVDPLELVVEISALAARLEQLRPPAVSF